MVNWKVTNLEYISQVGDSSNVIKNAHWWCELVNPNGNMGYCWGNQQLEISNPTNFTDFSDVTEEMVIGWVKSAMGTDGVEAIEKYVALMSAQNDPMNKRGLGLPWQL